MPLATVPPPLDRPSAVPPPWATWLIAALCVTAFLALQDVAWQPLADARATWRHLRPDQVFSAEFWRLALLATLLHGGIVHLALNLWCLLVFGPPFERRHGGLALVMLWVFVGYTAMGLEIIVSGAAKVGLSELTYTLLGMGMAHWQAFRNDGRQLRFGLVMLGLIAWGGLEMLHLVRTASGIGHVAHIYGVVFGAALESVIVRVPWTAGEKPRGPCRSRILTWLNRKIGFQRPGL